jgi:hypothetical protein
MMMRCIKAVEWDNCLGNIVTVIFENDIVDVTVYPDGEATAESTVYDGVSDFVPLSHFVRVVA